MLNLNAVKYHSQHFHHLQNHQSYEESTHYLYCFQSIIIVTLTALELKMSQLLLLSRNSSRLDTTWVKLD